MRRAALAVAATSAAAILCACALLSAAPRAAPVAMFFSFSSAPPSAGTARSTFMLPADAAADGYTRDLENMQETLQTDSLKPAGVIGDAPHLLSELGDG
jgi:hypothetical protein